MDHTKGSPVDPNLLYASARTHQWYDGTPHSSEFKRVWHFEPSLTDPDTVYAGIEDAAIFNTTDGGKSWNELPGLRGHGSAMAAGRRWDVCMPLCSTPNQR